MAEFGPLETITGLSAAADLTGKQYHLVRLSAAWTVNQASEALHASLIGVLQNKPKSGEGATVADGGTSKVVAGAAITAGAYLTTDSSGRAITVVSNATVFGTALTAAGATGDVITARLMKPVRWAGAA